MGFLADIITAVTSDASLNNYATGGIVYEHLPVDFDSTKNWIVFSYTSIGNTDVLSDNNVMSDYNLNLQIVSPSITTTLDISDRLIAYILDYTSGGIGEIILLDDDLNINTEKAVYYKTMNFAVVYKN